MRICVTCDQDREEILDLCVRLGLTLNTHQHLLVDPQYWIYTIECEPSARVTWLLLKYSDSLCVY